MDTAHLTPEQRERLIAAFIQHRDFFQRLQERMLATGWYTDDPLYQAGLAAYNTIHCALQIIVTTPDRSGEPKGAEKPRPVYSYPVHPRVDGKWPVDANAGARRRRR